MNGTAALGLWLVLLTMFAVEFFAAHTSLGSTVAPLLGIVMATVVSLTFMRLPSAAPIAKVFAVAGVFWLCIMLALGRLDSATRQDIAVPHRLSLEGPHHRHGLALS